MTDITDHFIVTLQNPQYEENEDHNIKNYTYYDKVIK